MVPTSCSCSGPTAAHVAVALSGQPRWCGRPPLSDQVSSACPRAPLWSGRLPSPSPLLRDAVGFRTRLVRGGCHDARMGHGLSLAPDNRRGWADTVVAATGRLRDAGQSTNQRDRLLPEVASRFVWNLKWPQLPADFD